MLTAMLVLGAGVLAARVPGAAAESVVYTAQITVPAPPASNFSGASGGGDGWGLAFTSTQVFNVFHHDSVMSVNCHNQSDATACWTGFKTVVDASNGNFATAYAPGLFVDQATGKLYVPGVRASDSTGGVVCIDTTLPAAATGAQLFCGFTALGAAGDSVGGGSDGLSAPVIVGSKWYIFNGVPGAATGTKDGLLCFDLDAKAPCAAQPFTLDRGGVDVSGLTYPIGQVGTRVFIQIKGSSAAKLACFDTATNAACGGAWPVTVTGAAGAPFPLLDTSGNPIGVCAPAGSVACFSLTGAVAALPPGLGVAIGSTTPYNGPSVKIGPRVYVPEGDFNSSAGGVGCYDFAQQAGCASFPKTFTNLRYLYSVNPDPARPSCIWVNADNGTAQIQNFDAFTGGPCGQGAIRILTSSIVVPNNACIPASYTSLQVLSPARSTYGAGTIAFQDASGNALPGTPDRPLDAHGLTDLSGLNLSTTNGLPQFLLTLPNPSVAITEVQIELKWTGMYATECLGSRVTAPAPGTTQPYGLIAGDGGVFAPGGVGFVGAATLRPGDGYRRSPDGRIQAPSGPIDSPIAGFAYTPDRLGYWLAQANGHIIRVGNATDLGDLSKVGLAAPIVGVAATPTGEGLYLTARDGGVFALGKAAFFGSIPSVGAGPVNDVVGIAATPAGDGYYLVRSSGGVYAFGAAQFAGRPSGLDKPISGIAAGPSGGYILVGRDGGIFNYGGPPFRGSLPGLGIHGLVAPVVGIAADPDGSGYWLAGADGGVFAFDALYSGSVAGLLLNGPIVGIQAI